MVRVDILDVCPGTCGFCGKDKSEVVMAVFEDGSLDGPFCWNDLNRAIRLKVKTKQGKTARPGVVSPDASA